MFCRTVLASNLHCAITFLALSLPSALRFWVGCIHPQNVKAHPSNGNYTLSNPAQKVLTLQPSATFNADNTSIEYQLTITCPLAIKPGGATVKKYFDPSFNPNFDFTVGGPRFVCRVCYTSRVTFGWQHMSLNIISKLKSSSNQTLSQYCHTGATFRSTAL